MGGDLHEIKCHHLETVPNLGGCNDLVGKSDAEIREH
jgi:hypothetical protein